MTLKKERGQIGFFNLTAGILLMHQRDCILSARKSKFGIFETLTKLIVCCSFVRGGPQRLNDFWWHIRLLDHLVQNTVSHNNRWKRQEIQPRVRSYSCCWGVHGYLQPITERLPRHPVATAGDIVFISERVLVVENMEHVQNSYLHLMLCHCPIRRSHWLLFQELWQDVLHALNILHPKILGINNILTGSVAVSK